MVGVVAAFAIALGWSIFSPWLGPRVGLVDTPGDDALKVHDRAVPLLGGVGIFVGVHVGLLLEGLFDVALFVATASVLILGLVDDRIGLSAKIRLGAEVLAAVLLVALLDAGLDTPIGFVLGVLFVVVAINSVNLLDGLDGLVGSVAVVSGLGLAWMASGGLGGTSVGFVLAASVAGFLVLNWYPARVFLGDNGAYTIGMILAYGILSHSSNGMATVSLVAVGVMGVFFMDLVVTILRRALQGRPLFTGDRGHIYDQLQNRGWSIRTIGLFAAAVQAVLAVVFVGLVIARAGIVVATVSITLSAVVGLTVLWRLGFLLSESR